MNCDIHRGLAGGPGAEFSCQAGWEWRWDWWKQENTRISFSAILTLLAGVVLLLLGAIPKKTQLTKTSNHTHYGIQCMIKGVLALWQENVVADWEPGLPGAANHCWSSRRRPTGGCTLLSAAGVGG